MGFPVSQKLLAGHYTDLWKKRKPIAVFGYAVTAIATGSFAFATHAYQLVVARAVGWLGRGVRSPAKKACSPRIRRRGVWARVRP